MPNKANDRYGTEVSSRLVTIKSDQSPVKVSLGTFRDQLYIDIRRMYTDDNGDLQHTRKGIRLSREELDTIIEMLTTDKAEAAMDTIEDRLNNDTTLEVTNA